MTARNANNAADPPPLTRHHRLVKRFSPLNQTRYTLCIVSREQLACLPRCENKQPFRDHGNGRKSSLYAVRTAENHSTL